MKKIAMMAMLAFTCVGSVFAQEESKSEFERGVFDHLSINVSAGTEGIGVGVATPVTNFLELEAGVNFMPGFKLSGDLDVPSKTITVSDGGYSDQIPTPDATVNAKGDFSRTTFNFKAHVYPFGGDSKFFVAAGFSFGGQKILRLPVTAIRLPIS